MIGSPSLRRSLILTAAAFGSVLAIHAPANAADARACFFANNLSNWTYADEHTLYLRVGVSDIYQLKLLAACPDLRSVEHIGIETRGGSSNICSGLDVTVLAPRSESDTGQTHCMATDLRKLSREEAKALPAKVRP